MIGDEYRRGDFVVEIKRLEAALADKTDKVAELEANNADLLEALEKAEEWLEGWASAEPYLSIIRAAIAKARKP